MLKWKKYFLVKTKIFSFLEYENTKLQGSYVEVNRLVSAEDDFVLGINLMH